MSEIIGNKFVVSIENNGQCDICGKIAELRPYGPNFSCICYECMLKDEEACKERFHEITKNVTITVKKCLKCGVENNTNNDKCIACGYIFEY